VLHSEGCAISQKRKPPEVCRGATFIPLEGRLYFTVVLEREKGEALAKERSPTPVGSAKVEKEGPIVRKKKEVSLRGRRGPRNKKKERRKACLLDT